ncbi:hypothetical protein BKA62DRAFT_234219 [Auriculariales sp. MPI-PUGE-AT-0066]|nr:hypothetical protein BKA62DRAFT_234219 [Auriculariales sp. MPI-PUGE-AT-0066]
MSSSSDQSPYPLPASGPPVSGAVIVEDNDLTGAVGFVGDWRTDHDPDYWSGNGSVHYTTGTGYGVLFTFEGTEVWLFGAKFGGTQSGGTIDIRIDDEPATRISTTGESTIPSTLLYSHSVSAGRHVLNVTNVDTSVPLYVDYFAYMPLSSPASAGVTTTSSNPSASVAPDLEPPISVGAAIGITLACVAVLLLLVAFIIFWLRRRRRRRQHVLANVELQSEYAPATDAHPSRAASPFLRPFELDAAPSLAQRHRQCPTHRSRAAGTRSQLRDRRSLQQGSCSRVRRAC